MKKYKELNEEELLAELGELNKKYGDYCSKGLSLDLSRGKPNSDQLDISQQLLAYPITREDAASAQGFDCRNYGILDGIPEMKKLFAELYDIPEEYISVGGNSSLQLMYDALTRAMLFGVYGSERPWCRESGLKWLCLVPGYDRHFNITEKLGFELINVPMTEYGPDMDEVERLVRDPKVKGMWCVPKYSNPTGVTYSDEVVRRLCSMECGAKDFRIMWDNAYAVHDLAGKSDKLANVFEIAREYGNEDRIFYFSSTSKITFPGAGVAFFAVNKNNMDQIRPYLSAQTIGYDKLNQLRHVRFLKDAENVHRHMAELAKLVGRKFDIVLDVLSSLQGLGVADWTDPNGGYFISLNVMPGCARRVFDLMKRAGVTLTPVGATFPYGIDPFDTNLRIAPTYPTDDDLRLACEVLAVSVRIAALELLLGKKANR